MRLAILFGGVSFEHEISIISAITLSKVLRGENPLFIFLDFQRNFYLISPENMKSSTFSSGTYRNEKKIFPTFGGFQYRTLFGKKKIDNIKVVNLIHGGDGEDGKIISLLEFYNIPAISPNREASIISYNKEYTKLFANSIGVKTLQYEIVHKGEKYTPSLSYPLIIKPLRLGSSIGVSVVENERELGYGLDTAFQYDDTAIVEPFIKGVREFNIAGTYTKRLVLSKIEEPLKDKILDFDKKYMDFSRDGEVQEADIPPDIRSEIVKSFQKIYLPLFKGSLIRCDFFLIEDEIYLNEINSVPGSLANYLFDDFPSIIQNIEIPKSRTISTNYHYIERIQKAK